MEESEEFQPPEIDVWFHLATGFDAARDELLVLPESDRIILETIGEVVFHTRSRLSTGEGTNVALERLIDIYGEEWVRYAIDLRLADNAVERAREGLGRYQEIVPAAHNRPFSELSYTYLQQATLTYVFGFDAPCIAFCGASLEHLLKYELVQSGYITDEGLRKARLSGGQALDRARREGLIIRSSANATRVLNERDRVMHRHIWDDRIIRKKALGVLQDLIEVLVELGR